MADIWDDQHVRQISLKGFAVDSFDFQTATPAASGSKSTILKSLKPKISNGVVPDDWELDEEEEEDTGRSVDLHNKQLWEDE